MTAPSDKIGLLFINFGEPDEATPEKVEPFLERIFLQNTGLEGHASDEAVERARTLAKRRAPGLIEDGVERLVALPVDPIGRHSPPVEALRSTRRAMDVLGWDQELVSVAGWHHHPDYRHLRAEHIARWVEERGLDLTREDTVLYFSVHGTPVKYLEEGNRYDRYVEESCRDLAERLGTDRWAVGFQNHTNRGIPWTRPDNEDRIESLDETRLVVVPISFMREQSETLAELDHELRAFTEELGKEFHRVPVPWDHEAFPGILADLVRQAVAASREETELSRCRCSDVPDTWCTNGARDLPPSPYVPAGA